MATDTVGPSSWSCAITTPPKDAGGFTVGEVFQVNCEGPTVALKEPLKVQMPEVLVTSADGKKPPAKDPNAQYKLVLLKPLSMSDNKIEYQATGYIPGEIDLKSFKIVDSENKEILVPQLSFRVQSIIDPNQQKPEPFGPIGPLRMEWPLWIFFVSLVVVAVGIGWGIVFFRRWVQKRNLERNIKKYLSPMGSYHQYNKDLRLLKQGVVFTSHQSWSAEEIKQYMSQLEEHFKMFLLREFIIPATSWPRALIVKNIQNKDKKGFVSYQKKLLRALTELERARDGVMTPRDCEQITGFCAQAVDAIWSTQRQRPKTAGGEL